jgi:hypothetical protein
MAKRDVLVKSEPITIQLNEVVVADYVQGQIERQVADRVEAALAEAVGEAVGRAVDKLGTKSIKDAIEKTLAEGWDTVNEYGEKRGCGKRTLKDRIGEILNMKDSYGSSRRWLDELMKNKVTEAVNKDLKADIDEARAKFKTEVDSVLTGVIKDSLAKHFGVKT